MKKRTNKKLYLARETVARIVAACPPEFDPPQSWPVHGEACRCVVTGAPPVSVHIIGGVR